MAETFYDVLGVDTDADESAIDDAFRERIKAVHPDVSDDPEAEERSRKLIEAKEVLTDEAERARYDRLGHDQYVRRADTDASWTADTTTRSPSEAATEWTETDSDASGAAESTWSGRGEWRHRRRRSHGSRRARGRRGAGDVGADDGGRTQSTGGDQTQSAGDAADRTAERSDGPTASTATSSGETQTSAGVGTSGNVGGSVGWATGGSYAVRNEPSRTGISRGRLFPPTQSVVLLVAAFFSYPGLIFSSVFPGFSPIVNVIVAACTLALIVYLASMPEVGIYVFGGWTVLGTFVVLASTIDPLSPLGLLVLGVTWLPLGLTVLTYWALRW
ncbi:DnaJ domain-containing protein [Halapricum hydrolyticum]|uniref:DnaJ domain-containing protein n=1 Tax=Halapricum hydrolyticum TaxID=2979991 RepID=A0AAE3IE84_9EURY|nr:DnaJ domain-containing protein [Halapricum hydrolyticum]MCU4717800.1 DnaJ domain-containing protein [Halapricum hydrolyticum]MCU4726964.1 DnaJ domain-containing protein [Halapricum hydrolyticum]